MRRSLPLVGAAAAAALSGTAFAADTFFGGQIDLRAGYGQNPRLEIDRSINSGLVGGQLTGILTRLTATGRSTLTGSADITQSTKVYGRTDNYSVQLAHSEQFSSKFSASGDITYLDTTNPAINYGTVQRDLAPVQDVLTIGTHTRQIAGDVNAAYQMTARDLFQVGANARHTTFSAFDASDYDQYGGTFGYLRTINDRTRAGVNFSASKVESGRFENSTSYSAGLQLTQKIGRYWNFNGGVSAVFLNSNGANFTTVGFNASFCGSYPRLEVCAVASRQTAPSGIGGLRIDTQGSLHANYLLTSRDTVEVSTTYDISKAQGIALQTQRYFDIGGSYRRTLTPRLSAGASARYQRRSFGQLGPFSGGRAVGYNLTADVTYRFGRTS